jgi:hypothetical protein
VVVGSGSNGLQKTHAVSEAGPGSATLAETRERYWRERAALWKKAARNYKARARHAFARQLELRRELELAMSPKRKLETAQALQGKVWLELDRLEQLTQNLYTILRDSRRDD